MTAVLVARRGGATLEQTLLGLAEQSRPPDRLLIVDATDDEAATRALADARPTMFVSAAHGASFGDDIARAVEALPDPETTSSPYGGVEEWLWLLRHDTAPDPRALERLLGAVEVAPSVAVAGPKQMDAAAPTVIIEFGETLTRTGASAALAERELDQGQHDRTSDVLAIGEAGMLVRRSVFTAVGGFDPALPSVDAALDLCVRIRLAGHRVVGVPLARVFVAEGTAEFARAHVPRRIVHRWRRAAQLHRRLVYAPAVAVPLHWLSLVPLAVLRSFGHLLAKQPTRVAGEIAAAVVVAFSGARVPAARRRLARARVAGITGDALAPLRMPPAEVRRRRAIARDARIGRAEDVAPPRPDFLPGGALVVALLAGVSAVAFSPLLGAASLLGGATAPLAPDPAALWAGMLATADAPADPFAFVLALLGVLTPWQPSLALGVLWVAAMPLAGLGAWWLAAGLVRRRGPAAAAALLWGVAPALLVPLIAGRPAAVIALIALPWLLAAAHRAPRSWSATAAAGLLTVIVGGSAPSLVPALLVAWLAWMAINPRRAGRLLTLIVPLGAVAAPLVVAQLWRGSPLALLADPGIVAAPGEPAPTGLLLGWPDLALAIGPLQSILPQDAPPLLVAIVLGALLAPLPLLALLGLALPRGGRAVLPLAIGALGLVSAVLASGVSLTTLDGRAVPLDVAPALGLYWLGLLVGVAVALDGLRRAGAVPGLIATIAGVAAVAPLLAAPLTGLAEVRAAEVRTLPAIVAASAADDPRQATLVLTPAGDGLGARLELGAGRTLAESRTVRTTGPAAEDAREVAELAANLAAASGRDAAPALAELDVRFVLLAPALAPVGEDGAAVPTAPLADPAAVSAALDATDALVPVGDTDAGRLWRVTATDDDRSRPPGIPATAPAVLLGQLGILALTLLLAIPTGRRPRRARPDEGSIDDPATTFAEGDDD
ncbi:glycosyltransferase [Microcella daejeonensis]|uniref:Glycosyltransferase n=1 Tax=Microcella daejeonensis TaxID=2994971 RepID=A0A9E8MMS9_9MICO|nr:glycosyltransferase [Microcella daejeonensis]WAB81857.1 glycosyltransferase [Microcella daejeonensis]